MKTRLLREFITLAETLNFTKTANKLYMTQPILTRHIKELEEKLQTELFVRNTHNVILTPAGEVLLREAKKIIQQYDDSMAVFKNFVGVTRNKLSIVYLGDAFFHILTSFIGKFKERYPKVSISYRDADLWETFNFLKAKEYDIGFVLRPSFINDLSQEILKEKLNLISLPFAYDPLCVAFNKKHPLASNNNISLEDISRYPIIVEDLKEFPWAKMYSTDFLQQQEIPFTVYKEYPNIKTCAFELELNKNVVLLLPKHRRSLLGEKTKYVELGNEDKLFYIMELVWNSQNHNPYLSKFVHQFTQAIENKEIT
ncbi:LysR family transcriptional regulator [Pasteurellaceae bacterium LIM206]|nr:LysR family transcriptional regulator [Pasteurellaceae bacterium LIM206]